MSVQYCIRTYHRYTHTRESRVVCRKWVLNISIHVYVGLDMRFSKKKIKYKIYILVLSKLCNDWSESLYKINILFAFIDYYSLAWMVFSTSALCIIGFPNSLKKKCDKIYVKFLLFSGYLIEIFYASFFRLKYLHHRVNIRHPHVGISINSEKRNTALNSYRDYIDTIVVEFRVKKWRYNIKVNRYIHAAMWNVRFLFLFSTRLVVFFCWHEISRTVF